MARVKFGRKKAAKSAKKIAKTFVPAVGMVSPGIARGAKEVVKPLTKFMEKVVKLKGKTSMKLQPTRLRKVPLTKGLRNPAGKKPSGKTAGRGFSRFR